MTSPALSPAGLHGPRLGAVTLRPKAPEYLGSSRHVCGLFPFAVGSAVPMAGAPLGRDLRTGAVVCADPIALYAADIISNPSMFVLGLPGLGKTQLAMRNITYAAATGVMPMVLGDLKPDYVDVVHELGGQVIPIGKGGHLNPLTPGDSADAIALIGETITRCRRILDDATLGREVGGELLELGEQIDRSARVRENARKGRERPAWDRLAQDEKLSEVAQHVLALDKLRVALEDDAQQRRVTVLSALISILRNGEEPKDWEVTLLSEAIKLAFQTFPEPTVADVLEVLQSAPKPLVDLLLVETDDKFRKKVAALSRSLTALIVGGKFSDIFAQHTTMPQRRDLPVVYDVSGIGDARPDLQGAVLLACWSAGFATVNASHALADAGIEPARNYLVVMDELHRALRTGSQAVDRIDSLTRLLRADGVAIIMISHTPKDLVSIASEADRHKAIGLIERSGMVALGGLAAGDFELLRRAKAFTQAEEELITSWSAPAPFDRVRGTRGAPIGRGKFLIKPGDDPGIPVQVIRTATEAAIHDSDKRWRGGQVGKKH